MWILAVTALVAFNDSAREVLQNAFAWGSVVVANNLWLLMAATVLASLLLPLMAQYVASTKKLATGTLLLTAMTWAGITLAMMNDVDISDDTLSMIIGASAGASAVALTCLLFSCNARTNKRAVHIDITKAGADAPDVIVVGASTTGASLAIALARQGRRVFVIEKKLVQTDSFIGELMQPGGVNVLRRMGLEGTISKDAVDSVNVKGYVVINKAGKHLPLSYPAHAPTDTPQFLGWNQFTKFGQYANEGKGLQRGRSFHNHRFVMELRKVLQTEPNITMVEGTATKLIETNAKGSDVPHVTGVHWKDRAGTLHEATAPLTVLCDGLWSGFRKRMTAAKPQPVSHFVGVKLVHEAGVSPLPEPQCGHVILTNPSPTLAYQISSTETRLLIDVPGKLPSNLGGAMTRYLMEFVKPQLPQSMQQLFEDAVNRERPVAMANRTLHTQNPELTGAILLGDAWNMRHPLTGGGMTVALLDVECLVQQLAGVKLTDWAVVEAAIDRFRAARKGHAATVNTLAYALYRVFSRPTDDDGTRQQLRDACFEYLEMGGMRTAGPVGLLSILTPLPWVLTSHFFFVAIHAMRRALFPFPTPARLRRAYRLIQVACIIIMPHLDEEGVTVLAKWPLKQASNFAFGWRNKQLS